MNCSELDQMLCPYLDGEFGPDERPELEGHLATCPLCARKVHQESAFRSAFRARAREVAAVPLPEGFRERVQVRIQAEDRRARIRAVMPYAAAALLAAGAGGAYAAMRTPARPNSAGEVAARPDEKPNRRGVRVPHLWKAHVEDVQFPDEQDFGMAYIVYEYEVPKPGRGPRHIGVSVFRDEQRELPAEPLPHVRVMPAPGGGYNVAVWRKDAIVYQLVADLTVADIRRMVLSGEGRGKVEHESAVPSPALMPRVPYQPVGFQQ